MLDVRVTNWNSYKLGARLSREVMVVLSAGNIIELTGVQVAAPGPRISLV